MPPKSHPQSAARGTCPHTGKRKEVEQTLSNTTAAAAARVRADLIEEIAAGVESACADALGNSRNRG